MTNLGQGRCVVCTVLRKRGSQLMQMLTEVSCYHEGDGTHMQVSVQFKSLKPGAKLNL